MSTAAIRSVPTAVQIDDVERGGETLSPDNLVRALAALDLDGFVQIDGVFEPREVDALREAYVAGNTGTLDTTSTDAVEVGYRRLMLPVALTGRFNDPAFYANRFVMPLVDAALGGAAAINSCGSVCAMPGAADQHVHLDHPPLFAEPFTTQLLPAYALTLFVPLVSLSDPDVGTTALWPGSHRNRSGGRFDEWDKTAAFYPRPPAGSVYLIDYRVVHFGTANVAATPRPICYLVYSRPWFTDAVNFTGRRRVIMSQDDFASVPVDLRRLLRHHFPQAQRE